MPWIRKNGKDIYVKPKEPSPVFADLSTLRGDAWQAEFRRKRDRQRIHIRRLLVDFLEFHRVCQRRACRRGGICKSPTVECYQPETGFLTHHFGEDFLAKLRARASEAGSTVSDPAVRRRAATGNATRRAGSRL